MEAGVGSGRLEWPYIHRFLRESGKGKYNNLDVALDLSPEVEARHLRTTTGGNEEEVVVGGAGKSNSAHVFNITSLRKVLLIMDVICTR